MKAQRSGFVRYILMFVLAIAVVRFFPAVVRMIQVAAVGARGYWWLILPVLVVSWVIWKIIRRRGSVAQKSGYQFESPHIRDVTDSARRRSEKNS